MKPNKDTVEQVMNLILAMQRANVREFNSDMLTLEGKENLQKLILLAKEYHKIQEHDCNGTKTERMQARELGLEQEIRVIVVGFGLKVNFTGDPRGFCVKLHAPKGDVYNTWGGAEEGYGIG